MHQPVVSEERTGKREWLDLCPYRFTNGEWVVPMFTKIKLPHADILK